MENKSKEEKESALAKEGYTYLFLEIFYLTFIKIIKCSGFVFSGSRSESLRTIRLGKKCILSCRFCILY